MTTHTKLGLTAQDKPSISLQDLTSDQRIIAVTGCDSEACLVHCIDRADTPDQYHYRQIPCGQLPLALAGDKANWAGHIGWDAIPSHMFIISASDVGDMFNQATNTIVLGKPLIVFPMAGDPVTFPTVCKLVLLS